jgi:4-amino-4-deoxy-L-arabinose transferase-like glycosyltransferase
VSHQGGAQSAAPLSGGRALSHGSNIDPALGEFRDRPAPVALHRWILILLVAAMTLPSIGRRELIPTDEPRFALVARQMFEDPAPLVPHLGYDPLTRQGDLYADKPPLFFWLISVFSFLTGGVNEISARLPSVLAAVAAVLLTRRLGALFLGAREGFAAALILAGANQFFLRAGWCSIDMLLTALVVAATDCWLRAARLARSVPGDAPLAAASLRKRATRWAFLGGLAASAATLSKGPVGLLFPLTFLLCDRLAARWPRPVRGRPSAPSAPSETGVRRALPGEGPEEKDLPGGEDREGRDLPRKGDRAARHIPNGGDRVAGALSIDRAARPHLLRPIVAGAAGYLIPVAAWIAMIWWVAGPAYTAEILFHQNVTRYVAAWNNIAPWYFYFYRLPLGLAPWTLLIPGAILAPWAVTGEASRPLRGLLLASGLLFIFFSATTGKRGVYLLPLYPALAILLAAAWCRAATRSARLLRSLHMTALLALGLVGLVLLPRLAARRYPELTSDAWILGAILAVSVVVASLLHLRGRRQASLTVQTAGIALLVAVGSFLLVPDVNRRSGLREFGAHLASVARPQDYLVVDQEGYEQILFYSHLNGARRNFDQTTATIDAGSVLIRPMGEGRARGGAGGRDGGGAGGAAGNREMDERGDGTGSGAGHGSRGGSRREAPTPIAGEAERALREARYPPGSRVLFVGKERRMESLLESLGASARVLMVRPLSGENYVVFAVGP